MSVTELDLCDDPPCFWTDERLRVIECYEACEPRKFEWSLDEAIEATILERTEQITISMPGSNRRDPVLSRMPYREYLATPHWLVMRSVALVRAGFQCRHCEAEDVRLDVHHLSYARLGRETANDLIVLCGWCHADEHGRPRS